MSQRVADEVVLSFEFLSLKLWLVVRIQDLGFVQRRATSERQRRERAKAGFVEL
jgi:hypothetical protein